MQGWGSHGRAPKGFVELGEKIRGHSLDRFEAGWLVVGSRWCLFLERGMEELVEWG